MLNFFFNKIALSNKRSVIWTKGPLKRLLSICSTIRVGRVNGRISVRHRSSKIFPQKIRLINNKICNFENEFAQIIRVERDPKRSAFTVLIRLLRAGFLCYISSPGSLKVGSFLALNPKKIHFQFFKKLKIHSTIAPLFRLLRGSFVCNFENYFLSGSKFCRSAGSKAKLQSFSFRSGLASLLLPSGKITFIPFTSHAFTGCMSNSQHYLRKLYKAGQNRWLGFRPSVRGVAMNPVDHPHGGGEGKTSGGRPSVSPWGKLTKGAKTISPCIRKKKALLRLKFLV